MSDYCKGCGVRLQNTHPDLPGYVPDLDQDYCQRCYKMRHYGQVTLNMQRGVDTNQTLEKINALNGTVFWTVDLFNLESGLVSRINAKLPDKKIVLILTKRDLLPKTLTDKKIKDYVQGRLKKEGIQVDDILIAGYLSKNGAKADEVISDLEHEILKEAGKGNAIFMGMANSGKSTLVSRLLASDELTISRNPGTTLDVIERPWKDRILYDTPGLENDASYLSHLDPKLLKQVIPSAPIKPIVTQIREDQSFAAGGLARLDVQANGPATVVSYFAPGVPIHRGKLADANNLWEKHLGGLLKPTLDDSFDQMAAWQAPRLKKGEKMDVVIQGLGWFCVSGDITGMTVYTHKGIQVTFRKAMI